jgi:hypothetical protein
MSTINAFKKSLLYAAILILYGIGLSIMLGAELSYGMYSLTTILLSPINMFIIISLIIFLWGWHFFFINSKALKMSYILQYFMSFLLITVVVIENRPGDWGLFILVAAPIYLILTVINLIPYLITSSALKKQA